MSSQEKFREKWPWNKEFLRLMLFVPSGLGIAATAILYPTYGFHALWFLTAILAGVVMYAVYGAVGRKVELLKERFADQDEEVVEALLVVGSIESPGVVVLHDSAVELVPIVGEEYRLSLDQITSVREGRWLPGKFVWGKRAFILSTEPAKRLAFAVPESVGVRWSKVLVSER